MSNRPKRRYQVHISYGNIDSRAYFTSQAFTIPKLIASALKALHLESELTWDDVVYFKDDNEIGDFQIFDIAECKYLKCNLDDDGFLSWRYY